MSYFCLFPQVLQQGELSLLHKVAVRIRWVYLDTKATTVNTVFSVIDYYDSPCCYLSRFETHYLILSCECSLYFIVIVIGWWALNAFLVDYKLIATVLSHLSPNNRISSGMVGGGSLSYSCVHPIFPIQMSLRKDILYHTVRILLLLLLSRFSRVSDCVSP